ncbi:hypothetical protein [Methanococcus maripaludis]|uniref:Uncharacterized protein n=1 Tax=Methanococcus maripaludis TaxID=39152 RepID=A0A7J9PMB9_METMI|nr:hypothetical protein [Methanococcus maripaludis]MBA2864413.1 hypothetical protein [Methanococcus maripaludis]
MVNFKEYNVGTLLTVVFTILFWAVILDMVILRDPALRPIGYILGAIALIFAVYSLIKY